MTSNRSVPTPDIPEAESASARFWLPDDPLIWGALYGALLPLTMPFHWEFVGTMSPEETADMFMLMLEDIWATKQV